MEAPRAPCHWSQKKKACICHHDHNKNSTARLVVPRGQPWCLLKCYHKLLTEDIKLAKWKNEQVKHCLELVEHTIYGQRPYSQTYHSQLISQSGSPHDIYKALRPCQQTRVGVKTRCLKQILFSLLSHENTDHLLT